MIRISVLLALLFMGCTNFQEGFIKNKKWRVVKETVKTWDKTGTSSSDKIKQHFDVMDELHFDDPDSLSVISYGKPQRYSYKIEDSVLYYQNPKAFYKTGKWGIIISTKDSLVLRHIENWGNDASLKVTTIIHFVPIKK
ncbi:hypothetical protein SAMN05216464_110163 [Mucilaginibacter pineti]|uniref:Lipocalin-like domain-containing protein n=1 Tax=Mucilaginibacter pineti TaxID=1391627 RepID=A0A1G7GIR7_9SPHI|nr:hypothetical protein [Mucilaginibacter pineti]SDE87973.1 hypothetical protein SAMN05216464_110163 [Mucilaginibacter pineti]